MKDILNAIVDNMLLFIGVMLFLVSTFLVLLKSVIKTVQNQKIPIWSDDEPEEEDSEIKKAKKDDIIEKPKKKDSSDKKKEEKEELLDEEVEEKKKEPEIEEKEDSEAEEIIEEIVPEEKVEELEQIEDEEIEKRIDEDHKEEIKEELEKSNSEEIKELLTEIKESKAIDPEEVVRNFEQEQESQSIISYQELVDVVKNRDNEFIDELEVEPLKTVSVIEGNGEKLSESDQEVLELIEQLEKVRDQEEQEVEELMAISDSDVEELSATFEDVEVLDAVKSETPKIIEVEKKVIPDNGKFQKTDVISPIYGRINLEKEIEYPKVEKFNRDPNSKKAKVELPFGNFLDINKRYTERLHEIEELEPIEIEESSLNQLPEIEELEIEPALVEVEELEAEPSLVVPEVIESFEKLDDDIMNLVMPKIEFKATVADEEGMDSAALEALGTFNNMLENVTIELTKKGKKKPEIIIEEISSDTEEIAALTSTHNFSQDEEFLKALKDFRDTL